MNPTNISLRTRYFPQLRAHNVAGRLAGWAKDGRQFLRIAPNVCALFSSSSDTRKKKRTLDREFIVSVLESSPTRRDARGYLQKYTSQFHCQPEPGPGEANGAPLEEPVHIAVVTIRQIQSIEDSVLAGVARTLSQLCTLGLLSVVVVDCEPDTSHATNLAQAHRLAHFIDGPGRQMSRVLDGIFSQAPGDRRDAPTCSLIVDQNLPLTETVSKSAIPVVVPTCILENPLRLSPASTDAAVVALVKHFSMSDLPNADPRKTCSVERVIILDQLGGLPSSKQPGSCHRFVNLSQEFDGIRSWLAGQEPSTNHARNLELAQDTLTVLPPAASALITSPTAAAHVPLGSTVKTRVKQNPLIHNLLTDKPVYSSSLPAQRISPQRPIRPGQVPDQTITATLVKRGLPLVIYPDPLVAPWMPPSAASKRPRLTDAQIDLGRLTHLINNSFGRTLDLDHYLGRVNENLAGLIIAGDYEGGAILTWERPGHAARGHVPYLDKFAVLKSRQGSGGVADVVFNAMVQDCFPEGVCWRSRVDNPVNRWYFERSQGSVDLDGSNWTMFWTNTCIRPGDALLRDYEDVCRLVMPSWKDHAIKR